MSTYIKLYILIYIYYVYLNYIYLSTYNYIYLYTNIIAWTLLTLLKIESDHMFWAVAN